MDTETVLSLAGTLLASLSLSYAIIRNRFKDMIEFKTEIDNINTRVTSLETKITPFWNWIDRELPHILKSPHTEEFDILLDKYTESRNLMTGIELERLKCVLRTEISKTSKEKILLYILMLNSIDSYIQDRNK